MVNILERPVDADVTDAAGRRELAVVATMHWIALQRRRLEEIRLDYEARVASAEIASPAH